MIVSCVYLLGFGLTQAVFRALLYGLSATLFLVCLLEFSLGWCYNTDV